METSMRRVSIVAVSVFAFANAAVVRAQGPPPEAYFLPTKTTEPIVSLFREARRSIHIATYVITDYKIAGALVDARNRGVKVAIVMDEEQAFRNKYSLYRDLVEQRIDVRVAKRDEGLMVNDFGIIDERSVYTGSSFLLTSFKDAPKFGNYLIFRDQGALSEQYEAEFRRLFEQRYYK